MSTKRISHKYTRRIQAPDALQMQHGILFVKKCVNCGLVFREHFYKAGRPPETNYERHGRIYLTLPECIDWDAEGETIE